MADLIDELMFEHQQILATLAALQNFAAIYAKQVEQPREILGHFVVFFRDYLDKKHHGKEEIVLFPAMVEAGMPVDHGPIGCMLSEHDSGRRVLDGIAALCEGIGDLTPREISVLCELTVQYAEFLSNHVAKENNMLYPIARRLITEEQFTMLKQKSDKIHEEWGPGAASLAELGNRLVALFGTLPTT